jgi:uncharacterized caspase-like protein
MRVTKTFSIFSFCLMLFSGLAGVLSPASAQQQEKRIALVVGNGAYAKSPLATAANDAGLIAQTLQAAGFDVIGARDLDGDTLRRSFRDFIQKAEASGPDTVAMVYLAGYGMQLAGENYFIPVDSPISRDTDLPTEGMRISDYVRQLASLPLKAGVVVLDAARQQPFIEGGQPLASGLALVEPDQHMLIAFNAAPGTIAPAEQGPYGAYAQSLAEMIRTGGLPLPEVFSRVRLRVNEASKGAQVPWDAQKIDAQFMFFNRAPDAPAQAPQDQAAAVRNRPIRDIGVQDAYAAALERDTMQGYDDFLGAYPGDPLAKRVRAIVAARREAITWLRSYRADTPQAYWSYLRRYPRGPHAGDARRRLAILTAALEPPPSFAVFDYDVPPPPPEEIVYVDRPVLMFSDPEFDFAPPPPPPLFFLPAAPADFIVLEPPPPPIGLFILPQPFFVPIPVYVQQPVYVVPPRNNIIFANIHNTTVINTVINRPAPPVTLGAGNVRPNGKGGAAPSLSPAAKGAPGQGGVTQTGTGPSLPPAVAQKASLIQQGKLPVPPSASINPAAARLGAPGTPPGQRGGQNTPLPANVAPNALPPGQALPRANALPVPGSKGTPPVPPGAPGPVPNAPNPNAKLAPQGQPGTTPPAAANLPGVAGAPKGPGTVPAPPGGPPRAGGSAQAPEARPVVPETARRPNAPPPPPPPPPKPAAAPPRPIPQAAPRPQPQIQRAEPPRRAAPPPPPPRPAPQMARPAPPPPRMAAPPPRAAPPPPPRPAPQIARPAPPPPPRPAAPPPPRPAPPAAAKKCPPNVPRC